MTGRWLDNGLLATSRVARRHSALVIIFAVILFIASLGVAWKYLEFNTERDDLIGSNDALYDVQKQFLDEFPRTEEVVVLVEGGDVERRESYVEHLASMLREHPEHFYAVFPKVELPFLSKQALMFLSEDELEELVESVERARPFLKSLGTQQGLEGLLSEFSQDKSDPEVSLAPYLPILTGVFSELEHQVDTRGQGPYRSPWGKVFFSDNSEEIEQAGSGENEEPSAYHTVDEGRAHLLLFRLKAPGQDTIQLMRSIVKTAGKTYPDLAVGVTGEWILEYDEMQSSERDSHRSAVMSLLLVAILFSISFRQVVRPLAAIFCLALAVGWTIGFTTIVVGHLNLLTISFATILIGLGIDFGIHLLFRYEEEFQKCGTTDEALDQALLLTGSDIVVGALSTATAFWAVGFADFKGVSEIGIIAGSGVILCLISTLTVLPALITRMDKNRVFEPGDAIPLGSRILMAQTEARLLRKARWVLVLTTVFAAAAWPYVSRVGFDYNLLRLQDPSLQSVQTELSLINKGGNTVLYAVSTADDMDDARRKKAELEALSTVARVDVISDLFPQVSPRKLTSLRKLRGLVQDIQTELKSDQPSDSLSGRKLKEVGQGFESLNSLFESERSSLLRHPDVKVRQAADNFQAQLDQLFGKLSKLGPGAIEDSIGGFRSAFFHDLNQMVRFLKMQDPDYTLRVSDLPENLRLRSVGVSGKILLRIYPKDNIWERKPLTEFVTEVRGADESSIGAPTMILHHTSILKGAFETSGCYALIAVVVMLLIYFRSIKWTLLALFPLGLGVYFMLFVMGANNVDFNPANFMGLPLLLGIGLDFGIHVLHRVQAEGRPNMFDHSTGPATAVSGLTTICGFGTLAMGGHQGVASLGLILASGVLGILIAALVVLPALLSLFWPDVKAAPEVELEVAQPVRARSA